MGPGHGGHGPPWARSKGILVRSDWPCPPSRLLLHGDPSSGLSWGTPRTLRHQVPGRRLFRMYLRVHCTTSAHSLAASALCRRPAHPVESRALRTDTRHFHPWFMLPSPTTEGLLISREGALDIPKPM